MWEKQQRDEEEEEEETEREKSDAKEAVKRGGGLDVVQTGGDFVRRPKRSRIFFHDVVKGGR